MQHLKTPGQKRRTRLRVVMAVLALCAIFAGGQIKGMISAGSKRLLKDHESATAVISEVKHDEVKYRKRKRTRIKHVYTVDYEFAVNGQTYGRTLTISEPEYHQLKAAKTLEVWYAPGNPTINATEHQIRENAAQSGFVANAASAGTVVIPVFLVLYTVLAFIIVREPKGVVPEGFVTENSWLDVDDGYLVMLDGKDLVIANFDDKRMDRVQKRYQLNASLEEMISEGKAKVQRIALEEIRSIESRHYMDTISVTFGENKEIVNVEFLNIAVKDHALKRIIPRLKSEAEKTVRRYSRMQAGAPALIGTLLSAGLLYFFHDMVLVLVLCAFGLFYAAKALIKRLVDPTVVTSWTLPAVLENAMPEGEVAPSDRMSPESEAITQQPPHPN